MSKRKPPLEVVRVVRAQAVDAAADSLRVAAESAREAEALARSAEDTARQTRAHEQDVQRAEARALGSARDFAQLAAFAIGAEQRIAAADERAHTSAAKARDERALEERAREGLVEARAALDVVERHQREAGRRAEREADARTDEAAEEAFAARFRRPL